jgi:EmrB/QacA subfamily drug resistance transporter
LRGQRKSGERLGLTLAVLSVATATFGAITSVVAPALPEIQRALGIAEGDLNWILSANLIAASVATPLVGRLGDMFGKDRLLLIVLLITAVGTTLCALATSFPVLLGGRVLQGVAGGVFPLAFGIIRDEFPRERLPAGIGLLSALLGVGGGTGVVAAGFIVKGLDYHWLFWIPLVPVLAAALGAWLVIPPSPVRAPAKINWPAVALLSVGIAVLLLGISEAATRGWGSPRTLGLSLAGLLVLAGWVLVETRADDPLVDMRMMRLRGVWTTNLAAFLIGWGMYEAFFVIPRFVQQPEETGYGLGVGVISAALMVLPMPGLQLVVGSQAGRIARRFGSKPPLVAGAVLQAIAYISYTAFHGAVWQIVAAACVQGVGIGLCFAALPTLIVQNVRPDQTGVATGMNTIMRTMAGAVGSQVAATFVAASLDAAGRPEEQGFTLAFGAGALVVTIGIAACVAVPRRGTVEQLVEREMAAAAEPDPAQAAASAR